MMLDQLGESKAAKRVMDAIQKVTGTKMKSQAAGKMGHTTSQIGNWGARRFNRSHQGSR